MVVLSLCAQYHTTHDRSLATGTVGVVCDVLEVVSSELSHDATGSTVEVPRYADSTKLPFEMADAVTVTVAPALPAVATFVQMRVLMLPLLSTPSSRQPVTPVGLPTVAEVLTVSARIIASPGCTDAGTVTRCAVALTLAAVASTKVIGDSTAGVTTTS